MHDIPGRRCVSRRYAVAHVRWWKQTDQAGVRSRASKGLEREKRDLLTLGKREISSGGRLGRRLRQSSYPRSLLASHPLRNPQPKSLKFRSLRCGGRPGDGSGARPEWCDRRFRGLIATSFVKVLRRPLESAQYASETYRKALDEAGLRGSMSAIGNPYHNAQAESS
jgi:hypothetical protein